MPLKAQHFESELKQALKTKPELDFRLDSRNSFINQNGVKVFGFKLGAQFDEKLSFGLGYNFLWSELTKEFTIEGKLINMKLGYYYFSPYVEYVFYEDQKWQLSIPVQFGLGESYYENNQEVGARYINRQFVASYEPAIAFQYRFFTYFGAGMGVGYRLMLVPNTEIEEQFTSPVYIFKFKVYFEKLLEDFGPNN
ncbi:MAG: hypothetical protein RIC95_03840 [Vicingaceae bacterium]